MIVASFAGIFITLTLLAGTPWVLSLAASVLLAFTAGGVELVSKKGYDNLTIPLTVAFLSVLLMKVASGIMGAWS